jgi:hypothetical protein
MKAQKYILTVHCKMVAEGDYPINWSPARIAKSLLKKAMLERSLSTGYTAWSGGSLLTCLDTGKSYSLTSEDHVIIKPKVSLITITEV